MFVHFRASLAAQERMLSIGKREMIKGKMKTRLTHPFLPCEKDQEGNRLSNQCRIELE